MGVLPSDLELTVQSVWRNMTDAATFKTSIAFIATLRADFCGLHNPMYAVLAAAFTMIFKVLGDVAIAISTAAFQPKLFD